VLAVVAVLNAAVAAFYYLRVVVWMYMREAPADAQPLTQSWPMRAGLLVAAVGTLIVGILPGVIIPGAQAAAQAILH
jgi:NADH-quinone oxidoreductase subunit N